MLVILINNFMVKKMQVINFRGVDITITPGSSSLLSKGVLPVGTQNSMPTLADRVPKTDNELVNEFIDVFGQFKVKSGVLGNVEGTINRLLGIIPTRAITPIQLKDQPAVADKPKVYNPHDVNNYTGTISKHNTDFTPDYLFRTKSYAQLRGTSAVGKGTRVFQLMLFLMEKYNWNYLFEKVPNHNHPDVKAKLREPELVPYLTGVLVEDLNILFIGRIVKSNKSGLLSLTGADSINSSVGFHATFDILKKHVDKNVIIEGYPGMTSNVLNPTSLVTGFGFKDLFYVAYQYDDKEQMLERVEQRSASRCRGDAAWSQMLGIVQSLTACKTQWDELVEQGHEGEIYLQTNHYTESIYSFGYDYLNWLGHNNIAEEFLEWSKTNTVDRDYRDIEANYRLVGPYYHNQNQEFSSYVESTKV